MDKSTIDMVIDYILIKFKEEKGNFKLEALYIMNALRYDIIKTFDNDYIKDSFEILREKNTIEENNDEIFFYLTSEGIKERKKAVWRDINGFWKKK